MYKTTHTRTPTLLQDLFTTRHKHYNLRDFEDKLSISKPSTDYLKCSLRYSGAFLWNSLPRDLRSSSSLAFPLLLDLVNSHVDYLNPDLFRSTPLSYLWDQTPRDEPPNVQEVPTTATISDDNTTPTLLPQPEIHPTGEFLKIISDNIQDTATPPLSLTPTRVHTLTSLRTSVANMESDFVAFKMETSQIIQSLHIALDTLDSGTKDKFNQLENDIKVRTKKTEEETKELDTSNETKDPSPTLKSYPPRNPEPQTTLHRPNPRMPTPTYAKVVQQSALPTASIPTLAPPSLPMPHPLPPKTQQPMNRNSLNMETCPPNQSGPTTISVPTKMIPLIQFFTSLIWYLLAQFLILSLLCFLLILFKLISPCFIVTFLMNVTLSNLRIQVRIRVSNIYVF